jgi:type I restriction enzyme, R subunit
VLDQTINSMTEFKQIIGRGTRLREDYQKLYFTIMDFKGATRLFADPDFDGEPVVIYEPKPDEPMVPLEDSRPSGVSEPEPPPYDNGATSGIDGGDRDGSSNLPGLVIAKPNKYVIDDVNVRVAVERSQYLDVDGKLMTEDFRVLLKDDIKKALQAEFGTMTDFLRRWTSAERKDAVLAELAERGVPLDILQQAVANGSELDVFDLVAHVAFDQKPLTRRERANHVKKRDVFGNYSAQARAVLEALLEKFADHGVQNIEDAKVLELPPFDQFGSKTHIRRGIFGSVAQYTKAVNELEQALYDIPIQIQA